MCFLSSFFAWIWNLKYKRLKQYLWGVTYICHKTWIFIQVLMFTVTFKEIILVCIQRFAFFYFLEHMLKCISTAFSVILLGSLQWSQNAALSRVLFYWQVTAGQVRQIGRRGQFLYSLNQCATFLQLTMFAQVFGGRKPELYTRIWSIMPEWKHREAYQLHNAWLLNHVFARSLSQWARCV